MQSSSRVRTPFPPALPRSLPGPKNGDPYRSFRGRAVGWRCGVSFSWRLGLIALAGLALAGCEDRTISLIDVAEVEIVPSAPVLVAGDSLALSAILRDRNGGALPQRDVNWSSQDPSVASVTANGLVKAVAEGTTSIQASVGSVQGAVPVSVEAPPTLEVEELEVTFESLNEGSTSTRKEVEITGRGGRQLTGLVVDVTHPPGTSSGWLEANLSRTTTPAILEIAVSPDGLEPGTHRGELVLRANEIADSPLLIQVELEVERRPPALSVSPSALAFQSAEGAAPPPAVAVRITDSEGGGVSGLAVRIGDGEGEPGWLAASLVDDTSPTDLTVTVDPEGLTAGVYDGVLHILGTEARNTPLAVPVRFLVGEPPSRIGLSPSRVSVTGPERGVLGSISPLGIRNEGGRDLTDLSVDVVGVGGSSAGWLTASLESTEGPTEVRMSVDQGGLTPGVYEADVVVRAPDADNSPQSSRVVLTVVPVASPETSTLTVSPDVLPADGEATALVEVQLRDSRGDPMPGGGDEVVLSLEGGGSLGSVRDEGGGRYTSVLTAPEEAGTARITGRVNGAAISQRATVEFEEGSAPPPPSSGIALSPSRVEVTAPEGATLGSISPLTVRSEGEGELTGLSVDVVGAGGSSVGWLTASLESSRTPTDLRLSVDQRSLDPGVHEAEVVVRAPDAENSPQSSKVILTVVPVASPETSTLTVSPGVLPADGEATALVEVQLRDSRGDPMPDGGDDVVLSLEGGGALGPVQDEGGGRYSSILTAPEEPGTTTIAGRVNGQALSQVATVEFEAEGTPPPPARLMVAEVAMTGTGGAGGDRHLRGTIRIEDGQGDPVGGARLSAQLENRDTGQSWAFSGETGSEGRFPFQVNNLPSGCYQLEVLTLAFEGWSWDGSTPTNEYCKD
jgi:hypothetical protein